MEKRGKIVGIIKNTEIFEGRGKAYVQGRPGYAPQALEALEALAPASRFPVAVDMGAGTGILSRELLRLGHEVLAVEPNDSMRQRARQALQGETRCRLIAATAEDSGLPRGCADLIAAASAFHWFGLEAFRAECLRLLRPGGWVFLLCNARREDEAISREQDELCRRLLPAYESLDHGYRYTLQAAERFFAPGYRCLRFPFDLDYTPERFVQRSLSSSYALRPGEEGYQAFVEGLESLAARHAREGVLRVGNDSVLWAGQPAPNA